MQENNIKGISIALSIYILIVCIICILYILEPNLYNKDTTGKKVADENVYNVAHGIISKKYEIILYEKYDNIYNIFCYNCRTKLKDAYNSGRVNNILYNFSTFQIYDVEVKNNKYIIYYYEINEDYSKKECKMIIKYLNNKAIIYYDSIMED